jgi:mono/diheme cytochrome c family protein
LIADNFLGSESFHDGNDRPEVGMLGRAIRLALAALVLGGAPAFASDPNEEALLQRGREIAVRCARCHAVEAADESPQRITIPFRDLARRYPVEMLVDAARTGIIEGHDEMPAFDLGVADIRALLTYIDKLNPKVPGYVHFMAD